MDQQEQVLLHISTFFIKPDVKRKAKVEKPSKKFIQIKPSVNKKSYE
jgi:hypothetical protein